MKSRFVITILLGIMLAVGGCGDSYDSQETTTRQETAQVPSSMPGSPATASVEGKVTETMDAGGYTYVHVDTGDEKIWAAASKCEISVGDTVTIDTRMPMRDFHSDTLDRTFDVIYFTSSFAAESHDHPGGMMGGEPGSMKKPAPTPSADVDLSGIARAEGGRTVAEIYADRTTLAGTKVTVRGRVVKYLSGIMGRNWVHLQDGTGESGANDLTVTTQGFASVGDLVVIEGTVAADRDFGSGYRYEVIVEEATVTKE